MAHTVRITRKDLSSKDIRRLAAASRDGSQSRRLLALAMVMDGASRRDAAHACGMDRQTLRDWVHRFNAEGPAGLVDRVTAGPACRLSEEQRAQLVSWLEAGPDPDKDGIVRWRCADLVKKIKAEFDVSYGERGVAIVLKRLGYRHISARPKAPASSPETQALYKKLRRHGGRRTRWARRRQADRGVVSG
jgi:transposase